MPSPRFLQLFNSLPAAIFCLSLVGAGWLLFAWTHTATSAPVTPSAEQRGSPIPGCSSGASLFLMGEFAEKETLKLAKQRSGAQTLRVLSDNWPRDLSFDRNRLNVEVDAGERIIGAFCG